MEDPEVKPPRLKLLNIIMLAIALSAISFSVALTWKFQKSAKNDLDVELAEGSRMENEAHQFLMIGPVLVSLGSAAQGKTLRLEGYIEVPNQFLEDVKSQLPRLLDSINLYLRAIESQELEDPSALLRIRMHVLKRVQAIVGNDRASDFLISKFVIG